jgi:hypothetical protein
MSGSGDTTAPSGREDLSFSDRRPRLVPALYIAHSYLQPDRIGECCPIDPHAPGPHVFGSEREGTAPRAHFFQIRPGEIVDGGPLTDKNLSRDQFRAEAEGDSLRIENVARKGVRKEGARASRSRRDVRTLMRNARLQSR